MNKEVVAAVAKFIDATLAPAFRSTLDPKLLAQLVDIAAQKAIEEHLETLKVEYGVKYKMADGYFVDLEDKNGDRYVDENHLRVDTADYDQDEFTLVSRHFTPWEPIAEEEDGE